VLAAGGQVVVELVGKEGVCSLSHNTQSEHVVFEERSTMPQIPEQDHQDLIEPGKKVHAFPFSMYLPGNIPPSLLHKDKVHLEGCSVKYHLTAKFESNTCAQELSIVGPPLSNKLYPAQVGPTVLPLTYPATLSSSWMPAVLSTSRNHHHHHHGGGGLLGSIILAAKVGNTHIGKGHALKFSTAVRNRSGMMDIESIQATIVERIEWNIDGDDKKVTRKRCDSTCLASVNCAGIPTLHYKKQQQKDVSSPSKTDVQVDDVLSSEMHGEMASPRNTLELKVPLNARDSYAGTLIQVSHHLVITAIMATTTCTTTAPAGGSSTSAAAQTCTTASHPVPCCHVEIPIKVFDPPVESHSSSSHSLLAMSSAGALDSTVVNLATTVWPEDAVVLHERRRSDSACSFSSINEEPPSETA
jgi:Arrestin (or S-antigen), N-terminal domain